MAVLNQKERVSPNAIRRQNMSKFDSILGELNIRKESLGVIRRTLAPVIFQLSEQGHQIQGDTLDDMFKESLAQLFSENQRRHDPLVSQLQSLADHPLDWVILAREISLADAYQRPNPLNQLRDQAESVLTEENRGELALLF